MAPNRTWLVLQYGACGLVPSEWLCVTTELAIALAPLATPLCETSTATVGLSHSQTTEPSGPRVTRTTVAAI